ncbi:UBA2 [Symbiodinium sp. CCMP2592]|nr:UBA2 [Symbiodinium sp. CCMP2592]
METMGKLIQMKVLISGLRGLGVEVAKNLILAGPAMVILHDDSIAEQRDLGANFYLTEQDVGSRTRAEASLKQLSELNPYVSVRTHQGPLTEELLSGVSLVVFSETSQSELLRWNEVCRTRNPPVGFIAADCFGLASSVFVDFGESFTCRDKDGEEPRSAIVSGVTLESPGTVHTHQDRRHGFNDGDWVVFREVQGMTQLNDGKPRQIKVTGTPSGLRVDVPGFDDMGSFYMELSGRSALGHKVQFVAIHGTPAIFRIPAHPRTPSCWIPALQGLVQLCWTFVTLSPRRTAMTGVEEYSNAFSLQGKRRFRRGCRVYPYTEHREAP